MSSFTHDRTTRWRSVHESPNRSLYRRQLGNSELAFYWDSSFAGTANTIHQITLDVDPAVENDIFSEQNVQRAWIRMKQRYPLLGASIDENLESDTVEFVVDEASLRAHRPNEIVRMDINDTEKVSVFTEGLLNGQSPLSNNLLSRVWVAKQKNVPCRYQVFICMNHCITDGVANTTATREFLQELSILSSDAQVSNNTALAERLASLPPIEDLHPVPGISAARRKWREATAKIIANLRESKKLGGHTLPKDLIEDYGKPALSRMFLTRIPLDLSDRILHSCRSAGITFGSTLPVLSQIAMSRVLHKRYRKTNEKGEPLISDDEWEFRRTQPMHFYGPVNFRPFINREWFDQGGGTDICLAISFSGSTLPFMPTCDIPIGKHEELNGAPHFSALLSPARFFHRARLVRTETERQLRNPLLFEMHTIQTPLRVSKAKAAGLAWRAREQKSASVPAPSTFNLNRSRVFANGGSSLGNRDKMLPCSYPTYSAQKRLHVLDTKRYLRCRPSELYLGASTEQGQLSFFSFVDMNTYDENTVQDWMEEIRSAAIHYLGHHATTA